MAKDFIGVSPGQGGTFVNPDARIFFQVVTKVHLRIASESYKALSRIEPKWPMRLKLRLGQLGADQEFRSLISCVHTGTERYNE
jgi:hypothetical protein